MKPIRYALLAAASAAMLIAPLGTADAQRRHHHRHHHQHSHGNVAGAVAFGLFSGALLGQALAARPHYHGPVTYCYDPYGRTVYCDHGVRHDPYYGGLPPDWRGDYVYRGHHDRIMSGHQYYNELRNERR